MKKYTRLTREERYQLEALLKRGLSLREIARDLRREASTISREVRAWKNCRYSAEQADERSRRRRRAWQHQLRKISGGIERFIRHKIQSEQWSPEQIARYFRVSQEASVSFQTIYRYVDRKKVEGDELFRHLRFLRKETKNRKKPLWKKRKPGLFDSRKMIDQRPEIVDRRERAGDWERDTMLGTLNGPVLLVIANRVSRVLKLRKLQDKQCDRIHRATVKLLKNEVVETVTQDNGLEFARTSKTERALGCNIYFAHPYHSWERGTNENLIGLIRQYIPRKTDIAQYSHRQIKRIEEKLNTRPRKCLGDKTPMEVHKTLSHHVLH